MLRWVGGTVAGAVVLFYDHILTLPDEHRFVWKAKASFAKHAFLLNRYVVPSVMLLVLSGTSKTRKRMVNSSAHEEFDAPAISDLRFRTCALKTTVSPAGTSSQARRFTRVPGVNGSSLRQEWWPSSRWPSPTFSYCYGSWCSGRVTRYIRRNPPKRPILGSPDTSQENHTTSLGSVLPEFPRNDLYDALDLRQSSS